MNKQMIETAKNLIAMGKVTRDGASWQVDEQIVLNRIERGHSYLSCSCQNSSLYLVADCQHKIAVFLLESERKFNQLAEAVIKKYQGFKKINMLPAEPIDSFLEDLKLLRYAK